MFGSILVPVDLNEPSSWALAVPAAKRLATSEGAKLHVITVVPGFGMASVAAAFPEGYEQKMLDQSKAQLKELAAEWGLDRKTSKLHVAHGSIYHEILKAIKSLKTDLVVMASHRPELSDYLLGPNAARVVRHAPCSVFVVRP